MRHGPLEIDAATASLTDAVASAIGHHARDRSWNSLSPSPWRTGAACGPGAYPWARRSPGGLPRPTAASDGGGRSGCEPGQPYSTLPIRTDISYSVHLTRRCAMNDDKKTKPVERSSPADDLVVAVQEVRQATARHSMASDGGSSGRSDTNDSAAY